MPLLFTGTSLLIIAKYLQKLRTNRLVIGFLAIVSIIIYEYLLNSGNAFQLSPNTAFQNLFQAWGWNNSSTPLLRLFLVLVAWLLNCLPYLFTGILLLPLFKQVNQWQTNHHLIATIICVMIFLISSAAIFIGIPDTLKNILQAYSLLLLSIILSKNIQRGSVFQSVGTCSFGIYLIHPFMMIGVKWLIAKVLPSLSNEVSIISILTISIICFLASWLVVALLIRNKWIARYALGT